MLLTDIILLIKCMRCNNETIVTMELTERTDHGQKNYRATSLDNHCYKITCLPNRDTFTPMAHPCQVLMLPVLSCALSSCVWGGERRTPRRHRTRSGHLLTHWPSPLNLVPKRVMRGSWFPTFFWSARKGPNGHQIREICGHRPAPRLPQAQRMAVVGVA